jgi:hypothetical protein
MLSFLKDLDGFKKEFPGLLEFKDMDTSEIHYAFPNAGLSFYCKIKL